MENGSLIFGAPLKFKFGTLILFSALVVCSLHAGPKAGDFITEGPTKSKKISLTFDDGPGPHTTEFLDLLDQAKVKATFFLLGEQVRLRPKIVKEISERGHELANHTMTHMNYKKRYRYHLDKLGNEEQAAKTSKEDLVKDIRQAQSLIEKNSGQTIKILRLPYGIDRPWIKEAAKETGFVIVNWTYGTDWNSTTAEQQIPGYSKALQPGAVILLHDGWPKSEKSLEITKAVIKAAKEKGLEIVPLGELLGIKTP